MNWQSPNRVHFVFVAYVLGTMLFVVAMGFAEQLGLSREWLGGICLMASILSYALIGIYCRTTQISEYYVAGRRISGFYNGMASAADWMSAATFISLAGGLYLQGFSGSSTQAGGFAYLLGWTGGFCLTDCPLHRGVQGTGQVHRHLRPGPQRPSGLCTVASERGHCVHLAEPRYCDRHLEEAGSLTGLKRKGLPQAVPFFILIAASHRYGVPRVFAPHPSC